MGPEKDTSGSVALHEGPQHTLALEFLHEALLDNVAEIESSPYFLDQSRAEVADLLFEGFLSLLPSLFQGEDELLDESTFLFAIGDREQSAQFAYIAEIGFHFGALKTTQMATDPFLYHNSCIEPPLTGDLFLSGLPAKILDLLLPFLLQSLLSIHLAALNLILIHSQR